MEKPIIKDKVVQAYVDELEEKLRKYEESPYCNSYLALLYQIEAWNSQLVDTPIDLFGDRENKEFDRAHKFFTEQRPYFEQLDYLRKLMTPETQIELQKKIKNQKLGMAEKLAMKAKNG